MTTTVNEENNIKDSELYRLILKGLPSFRVTEKSGRERLQVTMLCDSIGMAKQGLYKRFEKNTISVNMARKLVALSEKEVETQDVDFTPLGLLDFEPFFP